jgi:hypothetical protein
VLKLRVRNIKEDFKFSSRHEAVEKASVVFGILAVVESRYCIPSGIR